ncbi:T9SS type A sorting domain-containing protein [Spirosoma gilvum]
MPKKYDSNLDYSSQRTQTSFHFMIKLFTPLHIIIAYRQVCWRLFFLFLLKFCSFTSSRAQWIAANSGTTQTLYSVIYNGGTLWATVGGNGTILTSPNGITWTARTSGITKDLRGISILQNYLIAVGGDQAPLPETSNILTSPILDGTTWTARTSPTTHTLLGTSYVFGIQVGTGTSGAIITSSDGITWTDHSFNSGGSTRYYSGTGGIIPVVVGSNGTILTTPLTFNWTVENSGTTEDLFSVNYGYLDHLYVAVGANGTILTSPNGSNWTARTSGTNQNLNAVYFWDGWIAVGDNGTILTSTDKGVTWKPQVSGTTQRLLSVYYGAGRWIITGESGTILYNSNPLPVSLVNFQGESISTSAKLSWATAWETSFSHFVIERSRDAKSFESIGRVKAYGTTNQQQKYVFTDSSLASGIWYYRLRQVDLDGTFTNSQTIAVRISKEPLEGLILYPNPGSGQLTLKNKSGIQAVSIYLPDGKLLQHQAFEQAINRWQWESSNHPSGAYLIYIRTPDGTIETRRWLKP